MSLVLYSIECYELLPACWSTTIDFHYSTNLDALKEIIANYLSVCFDETAKLKNSDGFKWIAARVKSFVIVGLIQLIQTLYRFLKESDARASNKYS